MHHLGINDIIVTPFFLMVIIFFAYIIGRKISSKVHRRVFFWGLGIKLFSAVAFGIIYAFVYDGGDTTQYWYSACIIGDSFYDSPAIWFKLIMHAEPDLETIRYVKRMLWYNNDPASYVPSQVAGLIAPFCFNTYTVMAMFFSLISFSGLWNLYKILVSRYPDAQKQIAISIFFIPSIFFWGSGLMKDTLTLGALCWLFCNFYEYYILRKKKVKYLLYMIFCGLIISRIKIYILMCMVPPLMLWLTFEYKDRIRDRIIRLFITPVILALGSIGAILGVYYISSGSERYSTENIFATAYTTGDYLSRTSILQEGSYYNLGGVPQTAMDYIKLIPAGINVTLFRPYIWEAKNIVMLMAALESAIIFFITLRNMFSKRFYKIITIIKDDNFLIFSFSFSLLFAFAVGVSTYNFGTLVRYKIPMMPFFISSVLIILHKISQKKPQKKLKTLP